MGKKRVKVLIYTGLFPLCSAILTTPVFAEEEEYNAGNSEGTVRSLAQLKALIQANNNGFTRAFSAFLKIMRNLCITTVAIAFAIVFISVVIQGGKLGSANPIDDHFNVRKRQEAYDGLIHAVVSFGIIGAAGSIFSALTKFFLGI